MREAIQSMLAESAATAARLAADPKLQEAIQTIASLVVQAIRAENKILFAGNGGSAADCQHLAGELVSRFMLDRRALPGIALTTDTSILTSISNDYGYEFVFSRQIEAIGKSGDILFAYSTSGNSRNIVTGLQAARKIGITTVGLTGRDGGAMNAYCDHCIHIPSTSVPRIQEGHLLVGHTICELAEKAMFPKSASE